MSITVNGIEPTILELERVGKRMPKRSLDAVRRYAKRMVISARQNAPVKDGFLVSSIDILGETTDENGRKTVIWGVREETLGPGYQNDGFRYDIAMEENDYNLGPRSQEKANAGFDVGPGYILRALWEHEDDLMKELRAQARRV